MLPSTGPEGGDEGVDDAVAAGVLKSNWEYELVMLDNETTSHDILPGWEVDVDRCVLATCVLFRDN